MGRTKNCWLKLVDFFYDFEKQLSLLKNELTVFKRSTSFQFLQTLRSSRHLASTIVDSERTVDSIIKEFVHLILASFPKLKSGIFCVFSPKCKQRLEGATLEKRLVLVLRVYFRICHINIPILVIMVRFVCNLPA